MSENIISDEDKIKLIKQTIRTTAGWHALALSIKNSDNVHAQDNCERLLRIIGKEKIINVSEQVKDQIKDEKIDIVDWNMNLSDLLVQTLKNYMERV